MFDPINRQCNKPLNLSTFHQFSIMFPNLFARNLLHSITDMSDIQVLVWRERERERERERKREREFVPVASQPVAPFRQRGYPPKVWASSPKRSDPPLSKGVALPRWRDREGARGGWISRLIRRDSKLSLSLSLSLASILVGAHRHASHVYISTTSRDETLTRTPSIQVNRGWELQKRRASWREKSRPEREKKRERELYVELCCWGFAVLDVCHAEFSAGKSFLVNARRAERTHCRHEVLFAVVVSTAGCLG